MNMDMFDLAVAAKLGGQGGGASVETVETTIDLDSEATNFANGAVEVKPESGQAFSKVNIPVPANLKAENIAEGVNIAGIIGALASGGGGGGSLPAGVYLSALGIYRPNNYYQVLFKLNGATYALTIPYSGAGGDIQILRYDDTAWTTVVSKTNLGSAAKTAAPPVVLDDGAHIITGTNHWIFNGETLTKMAAAPSFDSYGNYWFPYNGQLAGWLYSDGYIYIWDKSSDTWKKDVSVGAAKQYYFPHCDGDNVYFVNSQNLYKLENGVLTKLTTLPERPDNTCCAYNGAFYYTKKHSAARGTAFYKYDPATNEHTDFGYALPYDQLVEFYKFDGKMILESGDTTNGYFNFIVHDLS